MCKKLVAQGGLVKVGCRWGTTAEGLSGGVAAWRNGVIMALQQPRNSSNNVAADVYTDALSGQEPFPPETPTPRTLPLLTRGKVRLLNEVHTKKGKARAGEQQQNDRKEARMFACGQSSPSRGGSGRYGGVLLRGCGQVDVWSAALGGWSGAMWMVG